MRSLKMAQFTLYHHPYSVCSIQVRYTLALAGEPADPSSKMNVSEEVVDIIDGGQLSEKYLVDINPKGQVPALTSPSLDKSIPDSVAITNFIISRYPSLMPSSHKADLDRLLTDLHDMNYFSLSFGDRPFLAQKFLDDINVRLALKEISEQYRKALEYKLAVSTSMKHDGVKPDIVAENKQTADAFLRKVEGYLPSEGQGPWIFGLEQPTAFDAHLVVFVRRLLDVKRDDLVSDKLRGYAERAWEGQEFKDVMQGRATMLPE